MMALRHRSFVAVCSLLLAIGIYVVMAASSLGRSYFEPNEAHWYYSESGQGEVSTDCSLTLPDLKIGSSGEFRFQQIDFMPSLPATALPTPSKVCVDALWLVAGDKIPLTSMQYKATGAMCKDWNVGKSIALATLLQTESVSYNSDFRLDDMLFTQELPRAGLPYPYDRVDLTVTSFVRYYLEYADGSTSPYKTSQLLFVEWPPSRDWQVTVRAIRDPIDNSALRAYLDLAPSDKVLFTELRFERPLLDRVMFPVIVSVILLFILLLCFTDSRATFIEGAVGVFFGIFALNQALVPANTEVRTLVEVAAWGLYVALGGVVLVQVYFAARDVHGQPLFGLIKFKRQQSSALDSEIPQAAPSTAEVLRNRIVGYVGFGLAAIGSMIVLRLLSRSKREQSK